MTTTNNNDSAQWFEEVHPANIGIKFKITEKIYSAKSPFQQIDLYQTTDHGKLLAHDGMIMVTERDEFIYHDMIAHVPLFCHANPRNVLVIGGGDGGTVREVLRHPSVEKCTMVEIDGMVVDLCKKYLLLTSCEMDNPKVDLRIQDGVEFIKQTSESYDVILIDSSDPVGPATPLFNAEFYQDVAQKLSPGGVVVSQAESPYYEMPMQKKLVEILSGVFHKVHLYNYTNLSYPGGCWSFSWASQTLCPIQDFKANTVSQLGPFRYYNPATHRGAFGLPQFMLNIHGAHLSPLPL